MFFVSHLNAWVEFDPLNTLKCTRISLSIMADIVSYLKWSLQPLLSDARAFSARPESTHLSTSSRGRQYHERIAANNQHEMIIRDDTLAFSKESLAINKFSIPERSLTRSRCVQWHIIIDITANISVIMGQGSPKNWLRLH